MPYLPRSLIIGDGDTFHVTWQCHNFTWLLQQNGSKNLYYNLLLQYKERYKVLIHSYHLMDNHIHLSGLIEGTREQFSAFFRVVNGLWAREINRQNSRRGQAVMDRFRSPVIQTDRALLQVMYYQDLNSYRAGKVSHPRKNKWSSYQYYAHGQQDPLITPAPSYLGMADTPEERQRMYRENVDCIIGKEGLRKRDYSTAQYIGDPTWVRERYEEMQEKKRLKRLAYLQRQQGLYQQLRSP